MKLKFKKRIKKIFKADMLLCWQRCVCVCMLQSCPTLCDPMDCSPPGSSIHWILQARIVERVAIFSFRGSSWPRGRILISYISLHWQVGSFTTQLPGKPINTYWSPNIRPGGEQIFSVITCNDRKWLFGQFLGVI